MSDVSPDNLNWVVFELQSQEYAIPSTQILEMVRLDNVSRVPGMPRHIRGVTKLRDSVFPVVDVRSRLGLRSLLDERQDTVELLHARKQDHINWLTTLREAVVENHEFSLARDPHKCAFGKWYDNYHTENQVLAAYLKRFDAPHRAIHAIANEVLDLRDAGQTDKALARIEETWNGDMAEMIALFDGVEAIMAEMIREIVLVIEQEDGRVGLIVDRVNEVTVFDESAMERDLGEFAGLDTRMLEGIQRHEETRTIPVLNVEKVVA